MAHTIFDTLIDHDYFHQTLVHTFESSTRAPKPSIGNELHGTSVRPYWSLKGPLVILGIFRVGRCFVVILLQFQISGTDFGLQKLNWDNFVMAHTNFLRVFSGFQWKFTVLFKISIFPLPNLFSTKTSATRWENGGRTSVRSDKCGSGPTNRSTNEWTNERTRLRARSRVDP